VENTPAPGWTKVFSLYEYYSLRGQFAIFRDPQKYPKPNGSEAAKALHDDLEAILRDSSVVGVGVAIPLRLYHWCRETIPGAKDKFGGDAYYSALQTLMIECACIVRDELPLDRKGRPNRLAFVCDDTDRAPLYAAAYAGFKANNPALRDVIGGLAHLDDKTHPAVQAADMMASVTKEVALPLISEMHNVPLPSRTEVPRLKGIAYRISVWDYDWMMKLLAAQTFGEEYASLLSRHRQT
jgi:hypothetical protein